MNAGFKMPARVDTEPADRGFDLRKYLHFVWRHWMFIGVITALAVVIAVIYLSRATPLYTATTQVLLELQREKSPVLDGALSDGREHFSFIDNQLAILRSDSLLRRVVIKERLAPPAPQEAQSTPQNAAKDDPTHARLVQNGINQLRGALQVGRSGKAHVLTISITWDEPVRAAQLANAVADAYVVDQLDARFESARRASGWLTERLTELRQQLQASEEAVSKFRSEHGLMRAGPTVALNDQQLVELNSKLIAARADAAEKKTRVDFLAEVAAGKKNLDALPTQSPIIGGLRTKLADASQRAADLLARYSSRHPSVANVEAEKRDIERSIDAETQRMAQTVRSEYALARSRLEATEQAMREATGQGGLDNEHALRLRELERTAAVNKSLFEDFLQKGKITEQQSTFQARDARVIMPAQGGGQSFPNSRRTLMMALAIGFGLGVGGAFAMELLKAGFTTPREIEELLGVPVLASVRQLDKSMLTKDKKPIPVPFYQLHHPLSPFSESLRTLRSGIHMSDVDCPPKVIHITSARPGEGKSTLAVSLAISAAKAGLRVALVDADLRHPSTSRFFKLEKEKGLVDLLLGAINASEALKVQKDLQLMVIPAGSKSLNPPDVLGSERMRLLVSHLREDFDYVLLDTPPVGPVVDASIVARLADKTIFVVQWGATPRELVQTTVQQLSSHRRVAGVVLNGVVQGRAKKYGGEYYYGKSYEKYYST